MSVFCLSVLNHPQSPTAAYHGVGFQELQVRGSAHLAADDAEEVVLNADIVDGQPLAAFLVLCYSQSPAEGLVLTALPVKVLADGHPVEGEAVGRLVGIYAVGFHNAHADFRRATFAEYAANLFFGQMPEVLLTRRDDKPGHIQCSR